MVSHMKTIFEISHNIFNFRHKRECEIDNIKETLTEQLIVDWRQHMLLKPKLRTYVGFKMSFNTEAYISRLSLDLGALF